MKTSTRFVSLLGLLSSALISSPALAADKSVAKPVVYCVDETFVRETAALPPEQQVERVAARLKELNRIFDGKVRHKIENGQVTELAFNSTYVTNLTPVAALTRLQKLECAGRGERRILSDLSPLQGLPLTSLDCSQSAVADLAPLKAMPLTSLKCGWSKASDLSPLADLPLKTLGVEGSQVSDLAALRGLPLTELNCAFTKVTDLAPLRGLPLTSLDCRHTEVSDLAGLSGLPVTRLDCSATKVADLTPLQNTPLTSLTCAFTPVRDLSPLSGLKLSSLDARDSRIENLAPLKGMPLTRLLISYTAVRDLSPLQGCTTLSSLECYRTGITDLSPLRQTGLRDLNCDFDPRRDTEILADVKSLQRINGVSIAQFKEFRQQLLLAAPSRP
jgi:internalin A